MASNDKTLQLSFMDKQIHISNYGRYGLIFEFKETDKALQEAVTNALRESFCKVLLRFPYLAGKVGKTGEDEDNPLEVRYPDWITPEAEASRLVSFKDSTDSKFDDYNELAKHGFTQDKLPSEQFCPMAIAHHPGLDEGDPFGEGTTKFENGPLPAFATQATFIPGRLVLSL
ncbi:hypothetical protein BDW02DRAFT_578227 [Decorospora gaudefroyi]|uniref:Trichothecene 3-O-acetyltransferase-like N-terminal domain-containing protein n=1 Tax=Decorospora gaudefroyi TaxID=184978 RepID=A0A6A5KNV8_9PLEO|nr:hypothetical protein BDW02DRAFT_578227 [Decorospora gaudefroyi]